jgi:integrase
VQLSASNRNGQALENFLENVKSMNRRTADTYKSHLDSFQSFVGDIYQKSLDTLLKEIKDSHLNVYEVLSRYATYLQNSHYYNSPITSLTLRQRVKLAKNFFEYYDVDISTNKFVLKVKLPRIIRRHKEALDRNDIRQIILGCSDIRLKTYISFLASTGMRATEGLSIRLKDIDFTTNPVKVFVRGEYTKTKQDRYVYLSTEAITFMKSWLEYKYRRYRSCYKESEKYMQEYVKPIENPDDLIFAIYHTNKQSEPKPQNMYYAFAFEFEKTLDRIGFGDMEDNKRRRKITFHSFRRYVKSTISDLGYSDYSEWFIGHSGSTYWRKKESEKAELFKKIEPYLTYLDYSELETKGADIETKLSEKDKQIESLINKQEQFELMIQSLIDSGQLKPNNMH